MRFSLSDCVRTISTYLTAFIIKLFFFFFFRQPIHWSQCACTQPHFITCTFKYYPKTRSMFKYKTVAMEHVRVTKCEHFLSLQHIKLANGSYTIITEIKTYSKYQHGMCTLSSYEILTYEKCARAGVRISRQVLPAFAMDVILFSIPKNNEY